MLASAGDPERALGQQRYMKSSMPYRGITSGELKALLRPLLADSALRPATREAWEGCVRELWDGAEYREERYAATALLGHRAYRRWCDPDLLPLIRHLIVTGAWWDHVDELASHHVGPILLRHRDDVTPVLREWMIATTPVDSAKPPSTESPAASDDGALWLRRTAIICQLGAKEATDVALLAEAIEANLETDADGVPSPASGRYPKPYGSSFWIRKAIGWALRQHARTDPQWVLDFVAAHHDRLSGLSRREALKHL